MPQPKKPNLQPDAVVEALVSDPSQGPPGTTVLHGYLGRSPTEGIWRLYLNPALDEYVEIPEAEISHSETLPDSSGTTVWVPNTLPLKHVRTQTQDVQAEFLGGAITDELLATAPGPVPRPGQVPTPPVSIVGPCLSRIPCPSVPCPSTTGPCLSHQIRCNSAVDACPSRFGCASQAFVCASVPCPSTTTPCLSHQIRCNSAVDACPSRFGCASQAFVCPTTTPQQCPTLGIACIPSRFTLCASDPMVCPPASQAFVCPSFGPCPSRAGCPTEGFCGDPFDPGQVGGGGQIG
ncbi:MAG: hypothetical protein M3296_07800 [Actinomycetota bacterium]|nr:hypothetical protein [Actinomycetota bacterium]